MATEPMDNVTRQPHLVWVSTIDPVETMDAATWVDTTRELQALGWRVTLIARGNDEVQVVRNTAVLCLSTPKIYFMGKLLYHARIMRLILSQWSDVDVVMFHQISAPWLLLLKLIRPLRRGNAPKRPLFIMDTRDMPDPSDTSWRVNLHLKFYQFAHWLANRFADAQIAITEKMAELVKIPPHQLVGTWPSGVDVEKFSLTPPIRQWAHNGDPVQLIYIGSLLKKRNPLALCEAVKAVSAAGVNVQLTLYGDGEERPNIEAFAQKAGEMIRIEPPVPHDAVPRLLNQAHVGVTSLPEPDDEKYQASSPVKLFEYMAAGLPILGTSNLCHTNVLNGAPYAFWAESPSKEALAHALRQIWEQRAELPALSAAARADADEWTWAGAARKLNAALHEALRRLG